MSDKFECVDLDLLSTVHGGAEGAGGNQWNEDVSIPVPGAPPIIHNEQSRTDWGYCADTVREMGGKIGDIANVCGKPPPPASSSGGVQ